MYDTKTPEEYMRLLEQSLYEIEDLIRCSEDEGDVDIELTNQVPRLQHIRAGLKRIAEQLASGEHEFGKDKDLPFMEQVRALNYLPFRPMFDALNATYRKGFK